jgi:hypothetical protein
MTSDNEESSRYLTFAGGTMGKEKFEDYSVKTMGVAREKKFLTALEKDLGPLISEMEAVSGEKTVLSGTTLQAITPGEKELYEMEGKALGHLTKTCTGVALRYISNCKTAHEMWKVLTTKYAPILLERNRPVQSRLAVCATVNFTR